MNEIALSAFLLSAFNKLSLQTADFWKSTGPKLNPKDDFKKFFTEDIKEFRKESIALEGKMDPGSDGDAARDLFREHPDLPRACLNWRHFAPEDMVMSRDVFVVASVGLLLASKSCIGSYGKYYLHMCKLLF